MKREIEVGNVYRLDIPQKRMYWWDDYAYIRIVSMKWDHFYGVNWLSYNLFWFGSTSIVTREWLNGRISRSKYVWKLKPRYKRLFGKQIWENDK